MIRAATTTPATSVNERKIGSKLPIVHAASNPAPMPPSIASPPRLGVGEEWTLRALGDATAPTRKARTRVNGVRTNVTIAAIAPTIKKSVIEAMEIQYRRRTRL